MSSVVLCTPFGLYNFGFTLVYVIRNKVQKVEFFIHRCRALDFKPSKSQKKVFKRVNKFLMGQDEVSSGEKLKSKSCEDMTVDDIEAREQFIETTRHHQNINMDIPFIEEEGDPRNEKCHGECFILFLHLKEKYVYFNI